MSKFERTSFTIQPMSVGHIEHVLRFCRDSGWNQLPEDWERLIRYEPKGCYLAECDGNIVGTVTSTRYGRELGWIGMMLVHPEFRRRGIANALMRTSIDYLQSHQVRCIKLNATPEGAMVYEQLGFNSEWTFHRWVKDGSHADMKTDLAAGTVDLPPSALQLDREAFGADRCDFLKLLADGSQVCIIGAAYGMLRPGFLASYLGPITASSKTAAESIIVELCERTQRQLFWDIPTPNEEAIQIARSLGFQPIRDLTRMWLGDDHLQPNLQLQYALADPSVG